MVPNAPQPPKCQPGTVALLRTGRPWLIFLAVTSVFAGVEEAHESRNLTAAAKDPWIVRSKRKLLR